MRVANTTIYDMVKFNLNNITEELNKANEVVSTGKRINNLSDDPVGLNQVLNIKSTLSNFEQLGRNLTMGISWLTASESAVSNVQNLISDAKGLCVHMATATTSSAARASAAEIVQNTLEEIVSLANTELNGRYVFAGSKTDTTPFSQDGTYNGDNNPFTINIGRDATVEAGSDGEAVFWDETVTINTTNNKINFIEYSGGTPGSELTATVQSGTYTHSQLATAIRNAMNNASDIDYVVTYDSTTKKFTIQDDGTTSGAHLELLWATGTNADISIALDIGFDAVDVRDALIGDSTVTAFTIDITKDTIDFKEDIGGGLSGTLTATIPSAAYASGALLAAAVETAMDTESSTNGNGVDYEVTYDAVNEKFIIEEDGTDLKELQILASTNPSSDSAGPALGFTQDDDHTPPTSDNEAKWGIFDTLIDLKAFLEANDVDRISKSIARLDDHFDHFSTTISIIGSKMIRMEIKENIFQDMDFINTERLSEIEDVDITEAIIELKSKELAYQAALASSAQVMQLSLLDYL